MSAERVELVRQAYDAWNRGDLDAALERVLPDIEFLQDESIPGAARLTGRAAVRDWLESFYETWESFQLDVERIEAVGERVLVVATITARGRLSEAEVRQRVAHVLTVRDDRVVRWESHADAAGALETLGLES